MRHRAIGQRGSRAPGLPALLIGCGVLAAGCAPDPDDSTATTTPTPTPATAPIAAPSADPTPEEVAAPAAPSRIAQALDVGHDMFVLYEQRLAQDMRWEMTADLLSETCAVLYDTVIEGSPALPSELPEYYCQRLGPNNAEAANFMRLAFLSCQWLEARPPMVRQQLRSRIDKVARALAPLRTTRGNTVDSVLDGADDLRETTDHADLLGRLARLYETDGAP